MLSGPAVVEPVQQRSAAGEVDAALMMSELIPAAAFEDALTAYDRRDALRDAGDLDRACRDGLAVRHHVPPRTKLPLIVELTRRADLI